VRQFDVGYSPDSKMMLAQYWISVFGMGLLSGGFGSEYLKTIGENYEN
jgi:hypothetical protein